MLRLLSLVTEVSIFSLNLTTAMGLGLAIDYSLFMVSRYREELQAGHDPQVAVQRTVRTAGRTVAFSAMTVAASLCALLVFPLAFLRSFAYAGVAVAFLAGFFSVVVLPAMLGALGHRIDSLRVFKRSTTPKTDEGFWHRTAIFVMRRPIVVGGAAIAVLLFLGAPFLRLDISPARRPGPAPRGRQPPGPRRDPRGVQLRGGRRRVGRRHRHRRRRRPHATRSTAYADHPGRARRRGPGRRRHRHLLRRRPGRRRPAARPASSSSPAARGGTSPTPTPADGGSTYLSVVPDVEPLSRPGEHLVKEIRATPAPFAVQVTGQSAQLVDTKDALFGQAPARARRSSRSSRSSCCSSSSARW